MFQRNIDPRYRFNPLYRNHFKPGQFVSNPNATLPNSELGIRIGLYDGSLGGFDWLGEENNTGFTYSDMELDRTVAELNEKGYGDNMGVAAIGSGADQLGFEMPGGRSINIRVWRSHSR
jgi:hypothetical protein